MQLALAMSGTGARVTVTIRDDAGEMIDQYAADPLSQTSQKKIAKQTGLPLRQVVQRLAQIRIDRNGVEIDAPGPAGERAAHAAPAEPLTITLRGLTQPAAEGRTITGTDPVAALREALGVTDYPAAEPVIQWSGTDTLCCLDVDYHLPEFDDRPSVAWLESAAVAIQPTPAAFHASHGRGCKLYYAAGHGFTARELAAAAAVAWLARDGRARVELKRESRQPLYERRGQTAGRVHWQTQGFDLAAVRRWFGREADPDTIDEYLSERGWTAGQALTHDHCPINPQRPSHGTPVFVGELGIVCQSCAAAGRSLGRTPGFTPWVMLVGGVAPRLQQLVNGPAHWDHAKLVLADALRLPDGLLRPAYEAVLKLRWSGDEKRFAAAMYDSGRDVIRMRGRWTSLDGITTYDSASGEMIAALPATWRDSEDGDPKPSGALRSRFMQKGDLTAYGYPHVMLTHGHRVYGHFLDYPDTEIRHAVVKREFETAAPKYLYADERMSEVNTRAVFETTFPGIPWEYLKLLVALKGFAEAGTTQAPFVVATGPSGSAKSSTVHVAASVIGDKCTEIVWSKADERFRQAVLGALDKGSFVAVNEIFKSSGTTRATPRQACDPLLNMTPDSESHKLYVGPVPLGRVPAMVLTDVELPDEVAMDVQLARRLIYVKLHSRLKWDAGIEALGIGHPSRFRLGSPETARACDSLLSIVIDDYFRTPRTLESVAAMLGYSTLEKCEDFGDPHAALKEFFALVCDAPTVAGADAKRYTPDCGWKVIKRGDAGLLGERWEELCDGVNGDGWLSSRRCAEVDWAAVLGLPGEPVAFDCRRYKTQAVYVRFRRGGVKSATWLNGREKVS